MPTAFADAPLAARGEAIWRDKPSVCERAVEVPDAVEIARLIAPAQADQPRRVDVGIVEIGIGDIGAAKVRAAELAAVQPGAPKTRVAQRGELEHGARKIGILEARAVEPRRAKHAAHQSHRL